MKSAMRLLAWGGLLALVMLIGWRVVATAMSDRLAAAHPQLALAWEPDNPRALAALARRQLEQQETRAARETAQRLLVREPLAGQGFVLLSEIAQAEGDEAQAMLLSRIASRHAPAAAGPRAWIIGEQLAQGQYADALQSLDRMLLASPGQGGRLFPLLVQLADDAEFADALAAHLAARPAWRRGFVLALTSKASANAVERVLGGVQSRHALDASEMEQWIARLVRDGKWGEAYARWAGEIEQGVPSRLPSVYNGGFEMQPGGVGFDWQIGNSAGVIIERAAAPGASGSFALGLSFLGRRIDAIPLQQWLLLAPGPYRMRFRANAQDLRGDGGVQWVIRCHGSRSDLATSARLSGNLDWADHEFEVVIPAQDCQVQDLSLRNSGTDGAGKIISGTLWIDDLSIGRIEQHL